MKLAIASFLLLFSSTAFAQVKVASDTSSVIYDTVYVSDTSAAKPGEPRATEESLGHCVMLPGDLAKPARRRCCEDGCARKED